MTMRIMMNMIEYSREKKYVDDGDRLKKYIEMKLF